MLAAISAMAEPLVVANRPMVRIRADATIQSEQISQLQLGDEVPLLKRKDEWLQVRLKDGRLGWVNSFLMQDRLVVAKAGAQLRAEASAGAQLVATPEEGVEANQLSKRGKWVEVGLDDGKVGWVNQAFVRSKTNEEPPAVPRATTAAKENLPVRRNPYAEGLQFKAADEHAQALARFEEVLSADPGNYNALIHAAQSQRQLQEYDGALARLYRGLEDFGPRRELLMTLGEVYRVTGQPDSTRKYMALYRGEEYIPEEEEPEEAEAVPQEEGDLLVAAAVAAGIVLCALIAVVLVRSGRSRGQEGADGEKKVKRQGRKGFEQTLAKTDPVTEGGPAPGVAEELDQQLEAKWRQLRQETGADLAGGTWLEARESEQLEGQLEVLRQALETQGERERLYSELLEMQRQKIEAMSEEIRLLRQRRARK